jgi:large subunit ribosomal protein L24
VRKIKKGDIVIVTTGKDSGKKGKVLVCYPALNKIIVEKVNVVKKHRKATNEVKAGIVEMPAPINVSNVMLVCPSSNKPTRVTFDLGDTKKKRKAKISQEIID